MKKRIIIPLLVVAVAALVLTLLSPTAPSASAEKPLPPNNRAKGLVYDGLEVSTTGECKGGFKIKVAGQPAGTVYCTPGPDVAPANLNVQGRVAPVKKGTARATVSGTLTTGTLGTVVCDGDGVTGKRVQVIYAHAADVPSQYDAYLASFQQWAAEVDAEFQNSAAQTGGSRHVRYVTDSNCLPVVANVQLSPTGDDTFDNTIRELKALGYSRTDRKYMVFMDAHVYCGIANFDSDDKAASSNKSNSGPSFGRTDAGCWSGVIPAHELMHNLGGVQLSAPHSDLSSHCYDGYDNMCDHSGQSIRIVCSDPAGDALFDCNHDDYFNTNPPTGSYLATHWNTANSAFLIAGATQAPAPTPTPIPAGTSRITLMVTGTSNKTTFSPTSTFSRGSSVAIQVHAADQNGANLSGVSISLKVNKPDNSTQCTVSVVTDSAGNAIGNCAIAKNSPVGSWKGVLSSFSKSGFTADLTNSVTLASFTVQ